MKDGIVYDDIKPRTAKVYDFLEERERRNRRAFPEHLVNSAEQANCILVADLEVNETLLECERRSIDSALRIKEFAKEHYENVFNYILKRLEGYRFSSEEVKAFKEEYFILDDYFDLDEE